MSTPSPHRVDSDDTTTPPDALVGAVVGGRYRIVKPLGEGGMGRVYLGVQEAMEKQVAIKVLRAEYSSNEEIVHRFQQEAISASRIQHPNVLQVFDFGWLPDGRAFLAMEFLPGNDLADELFTSGPLEPVRALRILLQVCRALGAAHEVGVIHRDMKPDNVFLLRTPDGEEIVKIIDFGIAQLRAGDDAPESGSRKRRRTRTGMIFGTPEYMAPEQAIGRQIDPRVDVYAAGIILFEMLTAAVPFTGDTFMAVLSAHQQDPVPALREFHPELRISPELERVVYAMLAKEPGRRPHSMAAAAQALLATPEGTQLKSGTHVVPAEEVLREKPRRRTSAWLGVATLLGCALGGAALLAPPFATAEVEGEAVSGLQPLVAWTAPSSELQLELPALLPAFVTISVETNPPGAVVTKDGAQVCDATPCKVAVAYGERFTLGARKGARRGSLQVLGQQDQKVDVPLATTDVGPRCEVKGPGGLIVWRSCN